ncbi:MAG: hypothetical protein K9G70_13475 [Prolixibacteraceae bacterium]|nr:hypothetical protein [Prolixibacteraceae bacterium]
MEQEKTNEEQNNEKIIITQNRYPALKTISDLYKFLSWLVLISAAAALLYFLAEEKVKMGIISLVGGGVIALGLAAISEIIKVFIDIEYNTRNK